MITLCERLAGQDANVTTVPVSVLRFTRQLTRLFEWTNDVADRLAFSEVWPFLLCALCCLVVSLPMHTWITPIRQGVFHYFQVWVRSDSQSLYLHTFKFNSLTCIIIIQYFVQESVRAFLHVWLSLIMFCWTFSPWLYRLMQSNACS